MPPIDHELSISLVIWNGAKWLRIYYHPYLIKLTKIIFNDY